MGLAAGAHARVGVKGDDEVGGDGRKAAVGEPKGEHSCGVKKCLAGAVQVRRSSPGTCAQNPPQNSPCSPNTSLTNLATPPLPRALIPRPSHTSPGRLTFRPAAGAA